VLVPPPPLTPPSPAADLGEIIVHGARIDPLVSVVVIGDPPVTTIIRSDPVGVRCGADSHQYDRYAAPRLCWIRRPAGETVRLRAEGDDGLVLRWTGCTPGPDGRDCTVQTSVAGSRVTAEFSIP